MSLSILSLPSMLESRSRPILSHTRKAADVLHPAPLRRTSSQALLQGERELVIQHQGGEYHLRLTRNDKLILTK